MTAQTIDKLRVWDLPTRVFHWSLALSFFGAYLLAESERVRHLHVMFGYTVLALATFRILWGFIGTRYARFSSFAFGPRAVFDHARGLMRGKAEPHVGHTPAGSWAIWAMLSLAIATAVSGWLHLNEFGGEALEEVHEALANAWMLVVFIHVAGVLVSSVLERQNLVRAMVTGCKRIAGAGESVRNVTALGLLLVAGVAWFWLTTAMSGGAAILPADARAELAADDAHLSSRTHSDDD